MSLVHEHRLRPVSGDAEAADQADPFHRVVGAGTAREGGLRSTRNRSPRKIGVLAAGQSEGVGVETTELYEEATRIEDVAGLVVRPGGMHAKRACERALQAGLA